MHCEIIKLTNVFISSHISRSYYFSLSLSLSLCLYVCMCMWWELLRPALSAISQLLIIPLANYKSVPQFRGGLHHLAYSDLFFNHFSAIIPGIYKILRANQSNNYSYCFLNSLCQILHVCCLLTLLLPDSYYFPLFFFFFFF